MRTSRELSSSTKQKISQGVRKAHAKRTVQQKQDTRAKQSASMKAYWESIPKKEDDEPEIDTAYAW